MARLDPGRIGRGGWHHARLSVGPGGRKAKGACGVASEVFKSFRWSNRSSVAYCGVGTRGRSGTICQTRCRDQTKTDWYSPTKGPVGDFGSDDGVRPTSFAPPPLIAPHGPSLHPGGGG